MSIYLLITPFVSGIFCVNGIGRKLRVSGTRRTVQIQQDKNRLQPTDLWRLLTSLSESPVICHNTWLSEQ